MENSNNILKNKIIKRILNHSFIYDEKDLRELNIKELIEIQKKLFVDITIKTKYKNRHKI